jgi:hypothetical protein
MKVRSLLVVHQVVCLELLAEMLHVSLIGDHTPRYNDTLECYQPRTVLS